VTICLATRSCKPLFIPLALLYLKAFLVDREGYPAAAVPIEEFGPAAEADEIARRILRHDPDIVGLSCYIWNITTLLAVAAEIKTRRPGTRIVLGGPEVGPVADAVVSRHSQVDVVVKSEGEYPFADLVRAWTAGDPLTAVKGISFRDGGRVVETDDAPLVSDLDALPSPHLGADGRYAGRIICIETQRGCVFRCNFCFYNKDFSVRNRRFSLERVRREIGVWLERDIEELYLMDPVFNLNADRAREICRFIAEHNDRRVPIHAEIWAEFVDDEMARLMKAANFTFLEVGLQTTDERTLATVERRLKQQRFVEGVACLKRHGLSYELQLIYGLPGETRSSFRRSLNFAASLDPDDLAVFPLMVLPGTELWHKAAGWQLAFDPRPPYEVSSHFSMDEGDFAYGRAMIEACSALQRSRAARVLARERRLTFADLVDEWIAWQPERESGDGDPDTVPRFIAHVCEKHGIPADFYRRFAALERS
jgi:anaerobic magnesium-protoporphyrin IX monomethyl ester cyclase